MIGNSETMHKTEAIKKKPLCAFVHKCLHSKDAFSEFKDWFKIIRTDTINIKGSIMKSF